MEAEAKHFAAARHQSPAKLYGMHRAIWTTSGRVAIGFFFLCFSAIPSPAQQSSATPPKLFQDRPKPAAPVVLCIDDKPTAGGQPSKSAYSRAAANGFRSVLTLRGPGDGVDVQRERFMVEQTKMRYFNIPWTGKLPARRQLTEFLAIARDPGNHPLLVNCAFADRVAPFMMIFRVQEQGWVLERALEEAASSGLKKDTLRELAREYFAAGKKPSS